MRQFSLIAMFAAFACAALPTQKSFAGGEPAIEANLFVSGLNRPVYMTYAPGDPTRLFVLEKSGVIRVIENGVVLATPFLDINLPVFGGTSDFDERGLLGLAFHPDYQNNGRFFLNYTSISVAGTPVTSGDSVIAEFTVSANPNVANATGDIILWVDQPQGNHNGGWIGFGPDGFLYGAFGDGGAANDVGAGHTEPNGNSQDVDNLLGTLIRIDVDGDDFPADDIRDYAIPADNPFVGVPGLDEIAHYGLRNTWRPSFDRETGDLYLADVGQNAQEEVSVVAFGEPLGQNLGWRCFEGTLQTTIANTSCAGLTLTDPILTYPRSVGRSITGGYAYRGCSMPGLQGRYFYSDFVTAFFRSFRFDSGAATSQQINTSAINSGISGNINSVVSFAEDFYGELYVVSQAGSIFKIVPTAGFDDRNANGLADTCDLFGDMNCDGLINTADIDPFVQALLDTPQYEIDFPDCFALNGDVSGDGLLNTADIDPFVDVLLGN